MRRGFTLIELLVVIAIIAILAAILFPVFAAAKIAAKKTQNLSNVKNDNMSQQIYMTDNDDYCVALQLSPAGYNDVFLPNPHLIVQNRGQLLKPYSKNLLLQRHPLDPDANDQVLYQGFVGGTLGAEFNATQRSDRGYNYFYLSPMIGPGTNIQFVPNSGSAITRSAQTIMTADSVWDKSGPRATFGGGNWFVQAPSFANSGTQWWFGPWAFTNPSSWFQYGGAYDFDKGGVTMSFMDCHAKYLPTSQLWAGSNPLAATVFNFDLYLWGGHRF